jgi:predicted amidohydrolase
MRVTISLGQFDVRLGQPDDNFACARTLIEEAARRGSDLIVLPELWDTSYVLDRAAEFGGAVQAGRFVEVAALARTHKLHVFGSMLEWDGRAAANCAVWFTPTGEIAGVYRKIHLFRLMQEEKYLVAGDQPVVLDLPWGKTGLAICYDLRFPELFRRYALDGAVLVVIPAQWPQPRIGHWQTLLRARAIENQMFVAACNRVGQEGDTRFGGLSVLIDPWGAPFVEGGESAVLLTAEIDLAQVEQARRHIPVFQDRRPAVYGL